ncbi:MAG: KilA-N domain-containing protein [Brevinema sp.]
MQVVINKEDGYVNGSLLEYQIGMSLHGFFKLDNIKESVEHIKVLTRNKEKYQGESPWNNVKGVYVHPFLALEMAAIKKCEDSNYEEYYEFLKTTIIEFLEINQELKEQYNFIEEFHG